MTDTPVVNKYPDSTMPPQEIIDQQALLGPSGTPTTIAPWTHIVFFESIGSSIHGKSQRPQS